MNYLSSSICLFFTSSESKEVCVLLQLAQHASRRDKKKKNHVFINIFSFLNSFLHYLLVQRL